MTKLDDVTVDIKANTNQFRAELADAQHMAHNFGRSITSALEGAVLHGGKLSDILRSLALDLSRIALNAALRPLERSITNVVNSALSGLFGAAGLSLTPFAKGGVVSGPALFPLGGGRLGLAGESGAEAILPLSRGQDGRLGVRMNDTGPATNVIVNITTPDVASFRRSETQIGAMMSRALARGQRNL